MKSFILEIAGDAIRTLKPEQLKEQVADALADAAEKPNRIDDDATKIGGDK